MIGAATGGNPVSMTGDPISLAANKHESDEVNVWQAMNVAIDRHAGLLFAAWLGFFILKSVLLLRGLVYVYRVRSLRVHEVDVQLQDRLHALSERLGIESQQGKPAALSYKFSVNIGKQEVVPPIQPEQATEESPAKATQPAVETLKDTVIQFRNIRFEHTNQDMSDREMTANDDKGNVFNFKIVADKLTAVKVNGDEVPDNQIANYQEVFGKPTLHGTRQVSKNSNS
jgi:hypothetical protein